MASTWAYGVHAAIIEVDPQLCTVKIQKYVCIHDCGNMINPMIVEGQVCGGIAQGIGGALYEKLEYQPDGNLANASLMDFDARLSIAMGTADGRPAIEQYLKNEMAAGVKMQNITVEKSQRFGDVDYSQGTFTATGPAGQITGHWLTFGKCSGDVCNSEP